MKVPNFVGQTIGIVYVIILISYIYQLNRFTKKLKETNEYAKTKTKTIKRAKTTKIQMTWSV